MMSLILWALISAPASTAQNPYQNLPYWLSALESRNLDLKLNALFKLQDLRDPTAIPSIEKLLSDSEAEVRAGAARALGRFPYDQALRALEAKLPGEKDSYVRSEMNRSIRGLKATFKKQEDKASGTKSSAPTETESDELDSPAE